MDTFRRIRLNILYQLEYNSDGYYLLKSWKDLIEKHVFLDNEPVYNSHFHKKLNKRQLQDMIFNISDTLTLGFRLKEMYLNFNNSANEHDRAEWLESIILAFRDSGISEYTDFVSLLIYWKPEIINSFKRPFNDRKLSNALCENLNGRIRSYLSISNGISNLSSFSEKMYFNFKPSCFLLN